MPENLDLVLRGIAMGVAGSALMDVWSAVLRRRFGSGRRGRHTVYGLGPYVAATALAAFVR